MAASSTEPTAAADAPSAALPIALDDAAPDDRAARRTALRDLAAMIGTEVFY